MPALPLIKKASILGSILWLSGCISLDMPDMSFLKADADKTESRELEPMHVPSTPPKEWKAGSMHVEEARSAGVIIEASDEYSLNTDATYIPVNGLTGNGPVSSDYKLPENSRDSLGLSDQDEFIPQKDKPVWHVRKGDRLCKTIQDWAQIANKNAFCRDHTIDWEVEVPAKFQGDFDDAIQWIVAGFKYSVEYRPKALRYENAYEIYPVDAQ